MFISTLKFHIKKPTQPIVFKFGDSHSEYILCTSPKNQLRIPCRSCFMARVVTRVRPLQSFFLGRCRRSRPGTAFRGTSCALGFGAKFSGKNPGVLIGCKGSSWAFPNRSGNVLYHGVCSTWIGSWRAEIRCFEKFRTVFRKEISCKSPWNKGTCKDWHLSFILIWMSVILRLDKSDGKGKWKW